MAHLVEHKTQLKERYFIIKGLIKSISHKKVPAIGVNVNLLKSEKLLICYDLMKISKRVERDAYHVLLYWK